MYFTKSRLFFRVTFRLLFSFVFILNVNAQQKSSKIDNQSEKVFRFDLPIKPNYLTSYKYTERVRKIVKLPSQPSDTTERILNYFISCRPVQSAKPENRGKLIFEVNVDSMIIENNNSSGKLVFNTQKLTDAQSKKVGDLEVLAPSLFVNRPVKFKLSPYGELLSMESEEFDIARSQLMGADALDDLSKAKCKSTLEVNYAATTLLPWRLLAPIDRVIRPNGKLVISSINILDMTIFKGKVNLTYIKTGDSLTSSENHLILNGKFDIPFSKEIILAGFDKPFKIDYGNSKLTGDFTFNDGGELNSGWTNSTGRITMQPSFGGILQVDIVHDTFLKKIGTENFAVDDRVKESKK